MANLLPELLESTSRTFAATIPLLEEPLQTQVQVAYLLFRIADTLEDADLLPRDPRVEGLTRFEALLSDDHPASGLIQRFVTWCAAHPPTANADYSRLMEHTPYVFVGLEECNDPAAAVIRKHLRRTCQRMADFVRRADEKGSLALRDLPDLRDYCYAVAGIVGEMLCELVQLDQPAMARVNDALMADAPRFGEGLQLVNILKDAGADAREGRTYLPARVDRAQVFTLAAEDLEIAKRYTRLLHANKARRGTLAFHALPIRLADKTLEVVKVQGAGAKIPRTMVAAEIAAMNASLDEGGAGL